MQLFILPTQPSPHRPMSIREGRSPQRMEQLDPHALGGLIKTALLLLSLAALAALVGLFLFGATGVLLATLSVVLLSAVGMRAPAAWVMRLQGAVPVAPWQAPELQRMVERLASRAGVPAPALHIIPSPTANALTAGGGKERGALAITQGALAMLAPDEVEAVVAHEIAHLRARDTSIQQVAGLVSSSVTALLEVAIWMSLLGALLGGVSAGRVLLMMLLAVAVPVATALLRAALSRTREFAADRMAAQLTGRPLALARALRKLSLQSRSWLGGLWRPAAEPPWLRSHPSTRERIRRLVSLAPAQGSWVRPSVFRARLAPHGG